MKYQVFTVILGLIAVGSGCICNLSETADPYAYILKTDGKVFAIGDLHGDLEQTKEALALAGAIDASGNWVGENLVVVQTGDQIDRWNDDRAVLDLLDSLATQAVKHNSHLVILNGNHEVMNVNADMRYVTPASFKTFSDFDVLADIDSGGTSLPKSLPPSIQVGHRVSAFHPGFSYATLLSKRSFYAIINDTLFVHGGILPHHLAYGLENINDQMHDWMKGTLKEMPQILGGEGPLWSRDFSSGKVSELNCAFLETTLQVTNTKRMVVGHTIQAMINSDCNGKIWRIDVGMSKGYSKPKKAKPKVQILQIDGQNVSTLP